MTEARTLASSLARRVLRRYTGGVQLVRRDLFQSQSMHISHVVAPPAQLGVGPTERQTSNVLVMPLRGLFAKHDGPRRHSLATPNHALFISIDSPYKLSFPGGVGDASLVLRFSPSSLAQIAPDVMEGDGWCSSLFASQILLPPELVLSRSLFLHRVTCSNSEPLEIEELGASLLMSTLQVAREPSARARAIPETSSSRRRQLRRVVEAISAAPEQKWSLASLAELAGVSSWHLAHIFRTELGLSVYSFVLRARLAKALPDVLETADELAVIAMNAGFASHSHFTARFHTLFGTTPLELRRRANRKLAAATRKIVTARS